MSTTLLLVIANIDSCDILFSLWTAVHEGMLMVRFQSILILFILHTYYKLYRVAKILLVINQSILQAHPTNSTSWASQ